MEFFNGNLPTFVVSLSTMQHGLFCTRIRAPSLATRQTIEQTSLLG